jgi:hypothetical protein
MSGILTLLVIGTNYIGSCKFNYHTILTTMFPIKNREAGLVKNKIAIVGFFLTVVSIMDTVCHYTSDT